MATAPATTGAPMRASTILTLHARYEAASAEYDRADDAQPPKPQSSDDPNFQAYYRLEDGMAASLRETDALRLALLYQVPDTDEELAVLAYHLWLTFDGPPGPAELEREAGEAALNSVFDYLVSEGCAGMDALGGRFSNGAMLAFNRRRARTYQGEE